MTTWILLRGLTRESGHWGAFAETLRARLADARVLTLDLPGAGGLHRLRSPADIEATTQHCRQQLAVEPPFHLLAMSLGAMVAADWAVRWPGELAGCVLINTSLRPFNPWYQRLRPANYAALLGLAFVPQASRPREQTILRLTSRHLDAQTGAAVVDAWTALRDARPVSRANALRQLLAAMRYRAPARAPAVPLLVLASRRDALVDARCSQRLARQWHADFVEHPSAGHDLALDDGPWLADQVARWSQHKGMS
ncbi:acetoin dehydrogenase E2 subunit dihydrolipoyllysine-residue acetyltransferase [Variovorax sp. SRS16]|uniref:alpha/beta fold hydrolase n=1 Tax=Variovorax sp. SRS16 TaxID=282217 RepID=UPI001317ED0D|nr:alpha/beta hydrolase [Variovorax sp. SRS16]VTU34428.1 acetoin dehydrogenase E2 subunit dihydrolipoyllysine-residue acetyltransferase [Variovorax sp. SRS16]